MVTALNRPIGRRQVLGSMAATATVAIVGAPALAATTDTMVVTRSGWVRGAQELNGARVWRGLPFARPPIGPLRGRAPQLVEPWTGVRDATRFGSMAVQQALGPNAPPEPGSEDCLYLNVWAPASRSARPRPVLVWIHGGGFVLGSGSDPIYNGADYAQRGDLVFVTLNYRLGGFGFLATDRDPGSANLGLLDQVAALRWIRDNIAAFGGDPANVTVMGESAGGMSIGCLLGAPAARELFARAIIQSGGARPVFPAGQARQVTALALAEAGLRRGEDERLLKLSVDDLRRVFSALSAKAASPLLGGEPFHPAIDGVVLPRHPLLSLAPVPTMIGHCENEGATFEEFKPLYDGLPMKVRSLVGEARWSALTATYRDHPRPGRDPRTDLFSDCFTGIPSLRLADALAAAGTPVWSYRFDYQKASPIGAAHAADVAFTFGTPRGAPFPVEWTEEARTLSDRMRDSFIAFTRTGDPQTRDLPAWPRHDPHDLTFLRFDARCTVGHDFIGGARRAAWKDVPVEAV